jgi:hypothetical protein
MTRKQIDAAREARLWFGQIIVPAITLAASTMAIPEVRQAVATKANDIKSSIENKMKKKEQKANIHKL